MLKYSEYNIGFQEIPNEISLMFNISNCPHRCMGCHSPHLWDDIGEDLQSNIWNIIDKHIDEITCICFMGGDHDLKSLEVILHNISQLWPELKLALYSGYDDYEHIRCHDETVRALEYKILNKLNYLKIGRYISNYGGLDNPRTNQKMFVILYEPHNYYLTDITYKFQNRKDEL